MIKYVDLTTLRTVKYLDKKYGKEKKALVMSAKMENGMSFDFFVHGADLKEIALKKYEIMLKATNK